MRNVGGESRKTYLDKINNGFFIKYLRGTGLDIGGKGYDNSLSILPNAILVDLDYPNYDGLHLPFPNESMDYIYSSHTLEHISDYKATILEWFRVVKKNGFIVTVVPHRDLYEKKTELPSRFNGDHKRLYTPASLVKEFEDSLPINSFRVRHLQDNDFGHDYQQPAEEHSKGQYEIELVIEKIP